MQRSREEVVQIANAQKMLLWAILLQIVINIGALVLPQMLLAAGKPPDPALQAMVGLGILGGVILALVMQIASVVRLCLALKEGWATAVYVIFQFVPCVSLILLLFLNGRATTRLKECGIRVGLMGANARDLANYRPGEQTCPGCGEPLAKDVSTCPVCGKELLDTVDFA
jgi:hypothetical protein